MNAVVTPRHRRRSDGPHAVITRAWLSRIAVASVLLAAAAGSARAGDVYRCVRADGGPPVYTDTRCDAQARPIDRRAPSTIPSGPGDDLAALHDERRQRERDRRKALDARWLAEHHRAAALEQRIRQALVDGRVVAGMTAAQVRQAWGPPDQVIPQVGDGAPRERWVYRGGRDGTGARSVQLEDDRVVGTGRRAPAAP